MTAIFIVELLLQKRSAENEEYLIRQHVYLSIVYTHPVFILTKKTTIGFQMSMIYFKIKNASFHLLSMCCSLIAPG